jgi:membrane protease YdiL (CAAX protease family)
MYFISYWVMCLIERCIPEVDVSIMVIPILFLVYFVAAVGEEVGWSGYVIDPLQDRWSALKSSMILGSAWAIWHVVPDIQAHHTLAWIASQRSYTVVLRILIVWLYNNTHQSVFAATLFHTMDSVSYSLFPGNGSHYDPTITAPIAAVAAAIVTFLWGPKTLSRFRYATRC